MNAKGAGGQSPVGPVKYRPAGNTLDILVNAVSWCLRLWGTWSKFANVFLTCGWENIFIFLITD